MRIKRPLVCKHSARAGTDLASFVRVSNMEGCRRQVRRTERFERARNTATRSAAKGDALFCTSNSFFTFYFLQFYDILFLCLMK